MAHAGPSNAATGATVNLYYVAFVERGEARRIISMRRATRREVKYRVENG